MHAVVIDELSTCIHVAYRYILVRAQITLANCKMFVFLVFDYLIKNKKTNSSDEPLAVLKSQRKIAMLHCIINSIAL